MTVIRLDPVFRLPDAMSFGLSRRHISPQRIYRGYYSSVAPAPLPVLAKAALTIAGENGVVCGPTALRLAGVELPSRINDDPEVWIQVPKSQTWPSRPGVRLVRTDRPHSVTRIGGLSSLSLPYCWLQLARDLSVDELIEVADAMTRRQHPATTKDCLSEAIESWPRVPGVAKLRGALDLCVEGTDSIPETDLRLLLVRARLPIPEVNVKVVGPLGKWFYLDLAYKEYMLAIEYDGVYHVGDKAQMFRDAARRRTLEDLGWRIITVTSADLYRDPAGVVRSVYKALLSR